MKKFNWPLWAGFLLSILALLSYPLIFVNWPATRDFPWATLLLYALAAVIMFIGVRRAFTPERRLISKIVAPAVAGLSVLGLALFIFGIFIFARWLPESAGAPQVGQSAPEFRLLDTNSKPVSLSELKSAPINGQPPKGVLLIFYRGYW